MACWRGLQGAHKMPADQRLKPLDIHKVGSKQLPSPPPSLHPQPQQEEGRKRTRTRTRTPTPTSTTTTTTTTTTTPAATTATILVTVTVPKTTKTASTQLSEDVWTNSVSQHAGRWSSQVRLTLVNLKDPIPTGWIVHCSSACKVYIGLCWKTKPRIISKNAFAIIC